MMTSIPLASGGRSGSGIGSGGGGSVTSASPGRGSSRHAPSEERGVADEDEGAEHDRDPRVDPAAHARVAVDLAQPEDAEHERRDRERQAQERDEGEDAAV